MKQIRHIENLHISLWLMKDTCWLMQWKLFGVTMIVPTLGVAIAITVMNWRNRDDEFWINLAICFWISANAFWMCCEFFQHEELKFYSAFPFALGFLCVGWFYGKRLLRKESPLE
ncbi:MAG: hypothetical protein HY063_11200 [Bacteroidetes bacterium]|nr:hypothetical protein [Bacteroidota bacterium]